jgi:hypothetical protein
MGDSAQVDLLAPRDGNVLGLLHQLAKGLGTQFACRDIPSSTGRLLTCGSDNVSGIVGARGFQITVFHENQAAEAEALAQATALARLVSAKLAAAPSAPVSFDSTSANGRSNEEETVLGDLGFPCQQDSDTLESLAAAAVAALEKAGIRGETKVSVLLHVKASIPAGTGLQNCETIINRYVASREGSSPTGS